MEFRYPGRRGRRWKIGGLYIYDPNFESWIPIRSESEMTKLVLVHSNICWIFSKLDSSSNRMRSLTMFTPLLVLVMCSRSGGLTGEWELILKRWYNFQPKTLINEPKISAISNKEDFHGIAPSRILFWVWKFDNKQLMLMSRFSQDLDLFDPNSDLETETNQWPLIPLKYYIKSTWYYWNRVWADRNCPFSVKKLSGDGNWLYLRLSVFLLTRINQIWGHMLLT